MLLSLAACGKDQDEDAENAVDGIHLLIEGYDLVHVGLGGGFHLDLRVVVHRDGVAVVIQDVVSVSVGLVLEPLTGGEDRMFSPKENKSDVSTMQK